MALLTLRLATKRGCRLLETCQTSPHLDPQLRFFWGTATCFPLFSKEFSPQLQLRLNASIVSLAQANASLGTAKVAFCRSVFPLDTDLRDEAMLCLRQLFGFDIAEAKYWVESYIGFGIINPRDILRNYKACLEAGLDATVIEENPGILAYAFDILTAKIKLIKRMDVPNINDTIPFFHLSLDKLHPLSDKVQQESSYNSGSNRIKYMSARLEGRTHDVCYVIAKYNFLQMISYSRLVSKLDMMLEFNVSTEDILSDVWGFTYRPKLIRNRFQMAVNAGVSPIKPWMIRCPETCLLRRIGKEKCQRLVLGDNETIMEYLSKRLGCEKSRLTEIASKNPLMMQVSGPKVKIIIDFLLENGYTGEQILRVPRVFLRKLETIQSRLEELAKYKHRPKSITVFCKSQQEYEVYLRTVKQRWMKRTQDGT